jgi:hypothetical protein
MQDAVPGEEILLAQLIAFILLEVSRVGFLETLMEYVIFPLELLTRLS